jgi:predicted small lipoprotein YifL
MNLIVLTLIVGIVLSGCGQVGPLYLPDDASKNKKEQKK